MKVCPPRPCAFVLLALLGCGASWSFLLPAPANAGTPREFGEDVSHWQAADGISQASWDQMYADGKRFAFIKATDGLTGPDDAAMTNNVSRATAANVLAGVYHYPHPENRPTTNGAVQEADHFLSYAGYRIGPGYLRPVLDLEGTGAASLSTTALTDWVIAFSNRIKAQRGAGAAPIIYMNRSFARDEVDSRLVTYDLWLAYPTNVDVSVSNPPPTASYPKPTGVFNNWAFWQYSWTGSSGGISPLDLDVCHSDYRPLSAYLIPTPAPVVVRSADVRTNGFYLGFTNVPGTHFTVLAATDLSLPLTNWPVLGAATEVTPGAFQFADTNMASNPRRFYCITTP